MRVKVFNEYRPRTAARLMALLVSAGVAWGANQFLDQFKPMIAWGNDEPLLAPSGALLRWIGELVMFDWRRAMGRPGLPDPIGFLTGAYTDVLHHLRQLDLLGPIALRLGSLGTVVAVAGLVAYAVVLNGTVRRDRFQHLSGRRLFAEKDAPRRAAKAERRARRATGTGLNLAPGVPISRERETRHFLIAGATGAGKTVIVWHFLRQILARGDRAVVHCAKGDLTERLPTDRFLLLAPHDARSAVWDIGSDIDNVQAAREFSAGFIPASKEPMWAQAAREVMTGVLVYLMSTCGRQWSWDDLATGLYALPQELREILGHYYAPARDYITLDKDGQATRTTTSFLVTLRASVATTILALAEAWPRKSTRPAISLKRWLLDDKVEHRTLVFQRAAHLGELSTAWTSAAIQVLAALAASPLLTDDAERRVFFVLDEFGRLNLPGFQQVLEKGRSRGVCAVLGLQDIAQLTENYGEHVMHTWLSSIGTKLLGRSEASPTVGWICDQLVGRREVSWVETSTSGSAWDDKSTVSRTVRRETLPVVTMDFLEREVGRRDRLLRSEIRALVMGIEGNVYRLTWPIIPLAPRRPATVQADWLRPIDVAADGNHATTPTFAG